MPIHILAVIFAFFAEDDASLQQAFIAEMQLDLDAFKSVALQLVEMAGYPSPLITRSGTAQIQFNGVSCLK
nr:hypothetical protein [uncultured Cohaesibacter sp.]